VAVVAAGELEDLVAASHPPGQAQHRHGGFGARVDQAHLLDGHPSDDLGSKIDFGERGCPVRGSALRRLGHRADDLGMCVPEQHGTPGAHQVDQLVAVDVVKVGTAGAGNESRRATDGSKRTNW
jgi:hypothetical protein